MTELDHEFAFHAIASRRELSPGADNYIIDANIGLVSRATVWLHGDVWFIDHFQSDHPRYYQEYDLAIRRPNTFWKPRAGGAWHGNN